MSDLHLEFETGGKELYPIPYMGEDYLILAGDIHMTVFYVLSALWIIQAQNCQELFLNIFHHEKFEVKTLKKVISIIRKYAEIFKQGKDKFYEKLYD